MQRHLPRLTAALPGLVAALGMGCAPVPGTAALGWSDLHDTLLPIVGGENTQAFSEVAALYWSGTFQCSAVLVEDDLLITAAHCLDPFPDEGGLEVRFGADPEESTERIPVAALYVHPDFRTSASSDIGLLRITETASPLPVPWNDEELTDLDVGSTVTIVGFGRTDPSDVGQPLRRKAEVVLDEVLPTSLSWTDIDRGLCDGDSGGPAYLDLGAGPVLAGILREGKPNCTGWGAATRTDPFDSWLAEPETSGVPDNAFDSGTEDALPSPSSCACSTTNPRRGTGVAMLLTMALWAPIMRRRRPTCSRPRLPLPGAGPLQP